MRFIAGSAVLQVAFESALCEVGAETRRIPAGATPRRTFIYQVQIDESFFDLGESRLLQQQGQRHYATIGSSEVVHQTWVTLGEVPLEIIPQGFEVFPQTPAPPELENFVPGRQNANEIPVDAYLSRLYMYRNTNFRSTAAKGSEQLLTGGP